jgi:hypothetical protein
MELRMLVLRNRNNFLYVDICVYFLFGVSFGGHESETGR